MPVPERLRILMIVGLPWVRELGAARVAVELADHYRALGHTVDHFDYWRALPRWLRPLARGWPGARFLDLLLPRFAARAARFVRRHAAQFDVIDALEGALDGDRAQLGFEGVLIARSIGSFALYEAAERRRMQRLGYAPARHSLKHRIYRRLARRLQPTHARSRAAFAAADLVVVAQPEEAAWVARELPETRCVVLPFGLSHATLGALAAPAHARPRARRERRIAFIGTWDARKGRHDWPQIARRIREQDASVGFLLLGTYAGADVVLADFDPRDRNAITVHAAFRAMELPALLAQARVGAFPSDVEGFGLAVLEKLGAGLPVVAYDIAGPREVLSNADVGDLVPVGDRAAMADALLRWLDRDDAATTTRCLARAAAFDWRDIAAANLAAYRDAARARSAPSSA
jgi:glycosyltransferase involved in cell wall biosynthesis